MADFLSKSCIPPRKNTLHTQLLSAWEEISNQQNLDENLIENIYKCESDDLHKSETNIHEPDQYIQRAIIDRSEETIKYFNKKIFSKAKCVCFSEEHQIIFISVIGTSSIEMLNLQGECVRQIKSRFLKAPWGIAVHADSLYVTDSYNMSLMEFYIPTESLKVNVFEFKFTQPRQLAINRHNEIWVADKRGRKVVIINEKTNQVRYLEDKRIKYPMDIKFTDDEALILTQEKKGISIHIFMQITKEYLHQIIQSTRVDKVSCEFFTIFEDTIFIPDLYSKTVLIYDLSGKKIRALWKSISKPICLHVTKDNVYLLFPHEKTAQLQIY